LGMARRELPTRRLGVKVSILFTASSRICADLLGAAPPAMVLYSKFMRGLFLKMGFLDSWCCLI